MCGRYVRKTTRREIAAWFGAEDADVVAWGASYNVAPQTFQPVVRLNQAKGREIVMMRWGLIPFWAQDAKVAYSTINARAETVATAPAFREALRHRRCLVPADAFYEWQKLDAKRKQPFAIALASGEPYGFAGLWERWKHENEWLETFSIITTEPNPLVQALHTRMPVIVQRDDYERWLRGNPDGTPPVDLLKPFPADQMTAWKVDKAVGNVRNDTAQLLEPAPAEEAPRPEDDAPMFDFFRVGLEGGGSGAGFHVCRRLTPGKSICPASATKLSCRFGLCRTLVGDTLSR